MKSRLVGAAIGLVGLVGLSSQASATAVCSSTYFGAGTAGQANGTTTLPGTSVGAVVQGCQIGNLATNNVSGTGVFVSPGNDPSIFNFVWAGGYIKIEEALGNNGAFPAGVDVELGLLDGNSLVSSGGLANAIASINFSSPFVFAQFKTLYDGVLAAGTYVIDTYSGTLPEDPTYQINFTVTQVPEPITVGLLGASLLGLGLAARRRRA